MGRVRVPVRFRVIPFFYCVLCFTVIFGGIHVDGDTTQTFIVRVQNNLKPSVFSGVEQWYSSTIQSLPDSATTTDNDFLHVYRTVFHGFSARLTTRQAEQLRNHPGVLAVLPDRIHQIQTTRSPGFLGLSGRNPAGLLSESDSGSNVVIGVFDTGIWPERRSFRDEGLGPIPSRWKGECTEGERFTKNLCNRKIIGARYFANGYEAAAGEVNGTEDVKSARDTNGHGTHTASTAAGRQVANASLFGQAKGVAIGMAPKARIAVYKICWSRGCVDSDILAAFDRAVEDGVDVISISVGGGGLPYYMDPIAIGCFGAMEKGIFVSASAGNGGPGRRSVTNVAPWVASVGASTIDRKFPADLLFEDGRVINGASLYSGHPLPERTFFPIILAGNASTGHYPERCMPDSLDKDRVRGKIVVCNRGGNPRVAKGEVVKKAGGVGVIVANVAPEGEGLIADPHLIPGLTITESGGDALRQYISSSQNPRATMVFHGTRVGVKPAPVVASFSSRGPSPESIHLIKPDVIAPGVNILAAWPDDVAPTEMPTDSRRTQFNIASGTSMSCPHVSGLAALLKGLHPDWSPGMIKSALMTTAYTHDNLHGPILDEKSYNVSSVWDTGAGHVNPQKAGDPGLLYDLTVEDYLNFLCASNYTRYEIRLIARRSVRCSAGKHTPWDINYPGISVAFELSQPSSSADVAVTRTVTHVSEVASTYTVTVVNPRGATVKVEPSKMDFKSKGQKQSYVVRISMAKQPPKEMRSESGKLIWSDGKHQVVSPIVVTWREWPF